MLNTELQKIEIEVKHSNSKTAWNVVAYAPLGAKYKIAVVPYNFVEGSEVLSTREKAELVKIINK